MFIEQYHFFLSHLFSWKVWFFYPFDNHNDGHGAQAVSGPGLINNSGTAKKKIDLCDLCAMHVNT